MFCLCFTTLIGTKIRNWKYASNDTTTRETITGASTTTETGIFGECFSDAIYAINCI